jgi:transcriptional regulator with XRE-family HTH domain
MGGLMSIGINIKQRRQYLEMSQVKLSERTGLTPSAISQIENGKRKPSFDSFVKIADALRTNMDSLHNDKPVTWINMKQYREASKDLEKQIRKAVDVFHRGFYVE